MDERDRLLSEGLIEKLLKQEKRWKDRDQDERFMPYDNFADWYADMKYMFIMPFSKVEMLAVRVLQLYVVKQLHRLFEEQEGPRNIDAVHDVVRTAIEADSGRLLGLLRECWPAEWADIEQRNAAGQRAFGLVPAQE